ncbi:AVI_1a_G0023640.mRNA.1.CDS.1 [Saccharomyces cerevisiae]|nr:AVI_1a_G0023640.mRNA.1.CDS.1 [Saccharomyces cerevisiae]CAI7147261.1 AVI_1a_G0023640.mRNA.1.CDS.1 [Saccharomyces cerevisiae]
MAEFSADLCLFDLDGTIVSTTVAAEKAWTKLCYEYGVDPSELFKHSHGARTQEVLRRFFPKLDDTDNKGVLALEKDIAHSYLDTVSLIPGAENLLLSLDVDTETQKKLPERKWAIVTSGSPYLAFSWFETILKNVGKPKVFITGFDVKNGKPDPEGYSRARDLLRQDLQLTGKQDLKYVVFEDAPVGIKAGKAMGAITVGITSSYDKSVLFDAGADYVVCDLTQVSVVKNNENDGTIVSTTTAAESAWKKLCRQHGVDPVELFKHSHGARSQEMMKKFFQNWTIPIIKVFLR